MRKWSPNSNIASVKSVFPWDRGGGWRGSVDLGVARHSLAHLRCVQRRRFLLRADRECGLGGGASSKRRHDLILSTRVRVGACLKTVSRLGAGIGFGSVVVGGRVCKVKHPLRLFDFIQ